MLVLHFHLASILIHCRPETSRILLKVNSNPRQLNATSMANLLEADRSLREHAKNDLGVEIDSFGAGDEVNNEFGKSSNLPWQDWRALGP